MDWTWRVADREASQGLRLRYEPGSWGDVLKGVWVAEIAHALSEALPDPVRVADPFAGAPDYPLVGKAGGRLEAVAGSEFHRLQQPHLSRGRLCGTAGSLRDPEQCALTVFDADAGRRAAWEQCGTARVLQITDGWDALDPDVLGPQDLVLVDPYDLHKPERWQPAFERLGDLASASHLLLYLYNRAPRSSSDFGAYRRLREALEESLGRSVILVGRVPSDALLPRAWHEVLLVEAESPRAALPTGLDARLRSLTERLAWSILRGGIVEGGV